MVPYSSTGSRDFFAADLFVLTFDPAELIECRVDTYSTVVIKQNHYLVPEEHVGKYIKAKVGAETIHLFLDGKLVAVHRRNWGVLKWEMDIYHYLETFQKKKRRPRSKRMLEAGTNTN